MTRVTPAMRAAYRTLLQRAKEEELIALLTGNYDALPCIQEQIARYSERRKA